MHSWLRSSSLSLFIVIHWIIPRIQILTFKTDLSEGTWPLKNLFTWTWFTDSPFSYIEFVFMTTLINFTFKAFLFVLFTDPMNKTFLKMIHFCTSVSFITTNPSQSNPLISRSSRRSVTSIFWLYFCSRWPSMQAFEFLFLLSEMCSFL